MSCKRAFETSLQLARRTPRNPRDRCHSRKYVRIKCLDAPLVQIDHIRSCRINQGDPLGDCFCTCASPVCVSLCKSIQVEYHAGRSDWLLTCLSSFTASGAIRTQARSTIPTGRIIWWTRTRNMIRTINASVTKHRLTV